MDLGLTLDGSVVYLLASCLGDGDTGGGLLYYDGESWIGLDGVSTAGLFVAGDELVRLLWAPHQVADSTAVLHYSAHGFERHTHIQGFTDPHDILWDGTHYVAVSAFQDSVVWVAPDGDVVRRYQPSPGGDCWHLNCLVVHEGIVYATAFGRFRQPRGWAGRQLEGTGMLFRLDTGEDVLRGLCCPHSPRRIAGEWILCNSFTGELRAYTAGQGKLVRCLKLKDWVRGLTLTDNHILVGESVNRQLTTDVRGAAVAVLDRKTWHVLGRLPLPYREVYDLALVSRSLLTGLRQAPHPGDLLCVPPEIPRGPAPRLRKLGLREWFRRSTT
jgi:acetolactate synthase I/II/III large subunit